MDNVKFAKVVREAGLLTDDCTTHDVDVVFAACKPRGCRRLPYDNFLLALDLLGSYTVASC